MSVRQFALAVLLVLFGAHFAGADESRDAAGTHYARGIDLARSGSYEEALQEFRAAYDLSPHFSVLYNIGQAQMALDHSSQAIDSLSQYLSDGAERIPEARRQAVQALISSLGSRLAEVSVTTDRQDARISIDGRDAGPTPLAGPLRVDAGTHQIAAKVQGVLVLVRIVVVHQGEHQTLALDLPAPSSKAAAAAAREAVAKALAAADAAARAAAEAELAARAATTAVERERSTAATRAASYSASRAATAQSLHAAVEAGAHGRATPGGGGR